MTKENERIVKLETDMCNLKMVMGDINSDVKTIMTNHLPHLKENMLKLKILFNDKIDKVDKKIFRIDKKVGLLWLKVSLITTIGVAILNFVVNKYLQ